ncbi:Sal-like protein 4 [Manis javanica]|nr:Sal-like protein 4 [Manis javanica]
MSHPKEGENWLLDPGQYKAETGNSKAPWCQADDARYMERADISIIGSHRPFQCRYCPYSASQKGNLKTHVLCVHRMPFDNSQYPDRRFKRSRVDSEASGNFEDPTAVKAGSSAELTEEGYKAQEERN